MSRVPIALCAGWVVAILVAALGASDATTFNLEKAVDENTAIPGGGGNFTGFGPASISRDPITGFATVCFRGLGGVEEGIYLFDESSGTLELVADENTQIPDGSGTFSVFSACAVSAFNVAFEASGFDQFTNQEGIYLAGGAGLVKIADRNTPVPSGAGNFTHLDFVSVDGDDVAFRATGPDGQHGIYARVDDVLYRSVDRNTAIPAGVGNFTGLFGRPVLDSGEVTYEGNGSSSQSGIYVSPARGGPAALVADKNTQTPGRMSNFTSFSESSIDGGNVSFGAANSTHSGIYIDLPGQLRIVADEDTLVPGGDGKFSAFDENSISGSNVAFTGSRGGLFGLYLAFAASSTGSTLAKVIDNEDTIDGRRVFGPQFWRHGLDGASVAFEVTFQDDSTEAIYLANLAPLSMDPSEVALVDPANASNAWRLQLRRSEVVPMLATELSFEVGGEVGSLMVDSDIVLDFDSAVSLVEVTSDGDWAGSSVAIREGSVVALDITADAASEIVVPLVLQVTFVDAPSQVSFQCCVGTGGIVEAQLVPEPPRVLAAVAAIATLITLRRACGS